MSEARAERRSAIGGCLIALLVSLLVLGLIYVAVDAFARSRVESAAAAEVASAVDDADSVTVDIKDWPLAWVLVTNRIDEVWVTATNLTVTAQDRQVTIAHTEWDVHDIRGIRDPHTARVGQANARVRISWEELRRLSGLELSWAGDQRVAVTTGVTVLGTRVQAEVTGTVGLDPATPRITITDPTASLAGVEIPTEILQATIVALRSRLTLPTVGEMVYNSISVNEQGVLISASASNILVSELA